MHVPVGSSMTRKARFFLAFGLFHLACVAVMVGLVATAPDPSGQLAAVYPPSFNRDQAFAAAMTARARFVRFGSVPWIVVVAPAARGDGLPARLRAAGAWAVLGPVVAGSCRPDRSPPSSQS